jgi:hypothetical protein
MLAFFPKSIRSWLKALTVAMTLGLLAGAGVAGYLGINAAKTIFELLGENRKLQAALSHLTENRQLGYVKVLEQTRSDGGLRSRLLLVVTDPADQTRRLLEREFTVEGDVVYVDALIVKFEPQLVMDGKARALHLLRRVYGENTPPSQGEAIETPGETPICYADLLDALDLPDREMFWEEIWKLSDDPQRLAAAGVQAVYGNAFYKRMRPGLIYIIQLDADGAFYPLTVPDL